MVHMISMFTPILLVNTVEGKKTLQQLWSPSGFSVIATFCPLKINIISQKNMPANPKKNLTDNPNLYLLPLGGRFSLTVHYFRIFSDFLKTNPKLKSTIRHHN